ncbi:MAG: alanine racemase [Rikenellaceae bacterium]|nr:alanine racemase [Rikenellaceae bacterium]MCL2692639.1 alanine racemase [Rikenellaceae bacterium]
MKYTLSEIAAVCGGELTGRDMAVSAVAVDSRGSLAGAETLFVAIAGRNHDGHDYIEELYRRGVRAFLAERDVAALPGAGFVRVTSAVDALQTLASDWRRRFGGTVVGITGSNGKTVVKEWAAALAPYGMKIFRNPKSYNSQIGVPLSVLMIEGDEAVAVIEAGVSQPGEMARLAAVVCPDIGIFTTLGDAHQENFSSLEEKAKEKALLFTDARTVIYNSAYPTVGEVLQQTGARLVDAAAWEKTAARSFGDAASQQNAAAAAALWSELGYAEAALRLDILHPVAMRLELREGAGGSLIVNDSYNSDINSLTIALDYLRSVAGGRPQVLVLSDILQSGLAERELYERVARLVAQSEVERVVGIGERIGRHADLFIALSGVRADFYPSIEAYMAVSDTLAGCAVLLKGNRDARFERLAHALESRTHTTVLEIDLDAMTHNLNVYRALLKPQTRLMAMVKASGYGNGLHEVAAMLQHHGVNYLAVAFADEGVALRRRGITVPVVVLNADADSFALMIAEGLEPEIYSFESLAGFVAELRRHGERAYPVHIKLDTGMHRLGFGAGEVTRLGDELSALGDLVRVSSVFSHLACADDPAQDDFTRSQIALLDTLSGSLAARLGYAPLRHIANSAAMERFPDAQFDMVRLGIGLYGIGSQALGLRPVSTLRTRVVQARSLGDGETVGYGREGRVCGSAGVAVLPVGYADGLDRRLGNGRWSVLVNGRPAPTIGRISMDTCAIDVTGLSVQTGDEAVVFCDMPGHTVEDMARSLDTIPYEIMTGIDTRVKRVFVKE